MEDLTEDDLLALIGPVAPEDELVVKNPAPAKKPVAVAKKPAAAAAKKPTVVAIPAKKAAAAVKKRAAPAKKPAVEAEATEDMSTAIAAGEKYQISSLKDASKTKGMWAGSLTPIAIPDLVGAVEVEVSVVPESEATPMDEDDAAPAPPLTMTRMEVVSITNHHTPALLKIMDEIIVNATDHAKEHERSPATKRVTLIEISFDLATGEVVVENDGPGIPVVRHAVASEKEKRDVYVPEVAFSQFLAGTNAVKDLNNVKGGTNGLGAKLANVHSVRFVVETADAASGNFYRQEFRDRLDSIGAPEIRPLRGVEPARLRRPHTRVAFVPAYRELGYGGAAPDAEATADLDAWLRLRAHQAAAYIGEKVVVTYNGQRCATTSAELLARLLLGAEAEGALILTTTVKATEEPFKLHPWQLAVVVLPPGKKAGRRAASQNMTVVNGVLSNKGSHVTYLKKILSDAVEDKLRRATKKRGGAKKSAATKAVLTAAGKAKAKAAAPKKEDAKMGVAETLGGVRLVMCGAIPGIDWNSQSKSELTVKAAILNKYSMTATFLREVGDRVAERILLGDNGKLSKVVHDKYFPARHAGKAKKKHTYLMAAEGDSAITLLKAGLTQTKSKMTPGGPSREWFGIISLQGVVINAAREVTEVETADGQSLTVRSMKLAESKRLLALADALGLRYDCAYATEAERATLKYGGLLLCVDQDVDGTGKIAPLVLVWVHTFWPALLAAGYVGIYQTPLVRAYPKTGAAGPVEFFEEVEFKRWLAANPARAAAHRIKYYKGLAAHDEDEVSMMFEPAAFERTIYRYTVDDAMRELFKVYYGDQPALRKVALSTPVEPLTAAEASDLRRRREMPIGRVQLEIKAKEYKLDAIHRQIPSVVDGLNPARRKILMGAIRRFAKADGKDVKIFQLGGYVADKCFYHHGDASLNGTITCMAQSFVGARAFPYLTGVGVYGSRHGDEAGKPRYLGVKLSPLAAATFPPDDRWHVPYVFEDGERAEPAYYVPVVPMAVLESCSNVSEGWRHESYGRDFAAVMRVVEAYIGGDPGLLALADRLAAGERAADMAAPLAAAAARFDLPASTRGYVGDDLLRRMGGREFSFGHYVWDEAGRTVRVTELPIGVTTAAYLKKLVAPGKGGAPNARDGMIAEIEDNSTMENVALDIKLTPEGVEKIFGGKFGDDTIDPIEDALMLRESLAPILNYFGPAGNVLELGGNYLAAILYWAPHRRRLYEARLTREQVVTTLRIYVETLVLRYIELEATDRDTARCDNDGDAADLFRLRGYPALDTALLNAPEYTPSESLHDLVVSGPGANYNYLLRLSDGDKMKSSVVKRRDALARLEVSLLAVNALLAERPTPGESVWRREIAAFVAVVERGVATGWSFKKKKKGTVTVARQPDEDDDE